MDREADVQKGQVAKRVMFQALTFNPDQFSSSGNESSDYALVQSTHKNTHRTVDNARFAAV